MKIKFSPYLLLPIYLLFSSCNFLTNALDAFPIQADYYLHDLYLYDLPETIYELGKKWKLNGVLDSNQNKSTPCGNFETMLGGYQMFKAGDYIERTYDSFPQHGIIFYYMRFYLIDKWETDDQIQIYLDNELVITFKPSVQLVNSDSSQCGDPAFKDAYLKIYGYFVHSTSSLTLKITSTTSSTSPQGYFGLSDLKIRLANNQGMQTSIPTVKLINEITSVTHSPYQCPVGNYFDLTTCKNCSSICGECFGPSGSECFDCTHFAFYNFQNNSCQRCTSNCYLCSGTQSNQCLGCEKDYLLYWNHTCQLNYTCQPPNVKYSIYCLTPCQMNNTYMTKDNTCSDSCLFPFISRLDGEAKFCDSPCIDSKYVYWNGTCETDCPYYPITSHGSKLCNICPQNNFRYPNSSCLATCSLPYKQRTEGSGLFCDFPCQESSNFYYLEEAVCRSTCSYPYQIYDISCALSATPEQLAQVKSMATALATADSISETVGVSVGILNFGNPASIFVNVYVNMFKKIKFINIKYPSKLYYFFEKKVDQKFIKIPDEFKRSIDQYSLPEKFMQHKLHSSFLVNFWQEILVLSFIVIIISLCIILKALAKRTKSLQIICTKIQKMIRWNLTLTLFTSYFGDMVIFTSLELRTLNLSKLQPVLSFMSCLVINLLAIVSLITIIYAILSHRKSVLYSSKAVDQNLENFEVTFKNYKTKYLLQQTFMLIFVTRIYTYSIIVGYLFEYPVLQASSLTFLSIFMLLYLIIARPFNSRVDFWQFFTQELVLLLVLVCTLILSVFDHTKAEKFDSREKLGDVILSCNIVFTMLGFLFLAIRTAVIIKDLVQKWTMNRNQKSPELESNSPEEDDTGNNALKKTKTSNRTPVNDKVYASSLASQFNLNDLSLFRRKMGNEADSISRFNHKAITGIKHDGEGFVEKKETKMEFTLDPKEITAEEKVEYYHNKLLRMIENQEPN